MNSTELTYRGAALLRKKKATDIEAIHIEPASSFADYLLIATGGSARQVEALTQDVEEEFEKLGFPPKSIEGKGTTGWVLLDCGDVIVNIFDREMRSRYSLEKVWGDCEFLDLSEIFQEELAQERE